METDYLKCMWNKPIYSLNKAINLILSRLINLINSFAIYVPFNSNVISKNTMRHGIYVDLVFSKEVADVVDFLLFLCFRSANMLFARLEKMKWTPFITLGLLVTFKVYILVRVGGFLWLRLGPGF